MLILKYANMTHIAIFHDGEYHYDTIPFIPQIDNIKCDQNATYDELLIAYRNNFGNKADLVRGIFILQLKSFYSLTTADPVTAWLDGDKAASQNAHQLRCCASGSVRILGTLPNSTIDNIELISNYKEICDKADAMYDIIKEIKRNAT